MMSTEGFIHSYRFTFSLRPGSGRAAFDFQATAYINPVVYFPITNRFQSPDSIVPNPADPQSLNRYAYAQNQPMIYVDPSGHCIVGHSGEVRSDQYPSGTSGICPHTDHWITEANHAISEIHTEQQSRPEPDGKSLYISVDPNIGPMIDGTGGFEILRNKHTGVITIFAVMGGEASVGIHSPSARFVTNNVFNIDDDNSKYAGVFVSLNSTGSLGTGPTASTAYTPSGTSSVRQIMTPNDAAASSEGIGIAFGVGVESGATLVEYIPLLSISNQGEIVLHANDYLGDDDTNWLIGQAISHLINPPRTNEVDDPNNVWE